jgi:hypothetical protein
METIAVCTIVGLAGVSLLVRCFGAKTSSGCSSGCGKCSCSEKRETLVNIRR